MWKRVPGSTRMPGLMTRISPARRSPRSRHTRRLEARAAADDRQAHALQRSRDRSRPAPGGARRSSRPARDAARRADRHRLRLQLHPHRYPRHEARRPRSSTSTATAPRSRSASKDAKLGQPSGGCRAPTMNANRTWLAGCLLALNVTALVCDCAPPPAPAQPPTRRCGARQDAAQDAVLRSRPREHEARQTIVRLPDGYRHLPSSRRPTRPPTHSAPRRHPACAADDQPPHPAQLSDPESTLNAS